MARTKNICFGIFLSWILIHFCQTQSHGQAVIIPKIGWSIPLEPPIVDGTVVDSRPGVTLGVGFRNGSDEVYFNPQIQFYFNQIDAYEYQGKNGQIGLEEITTSVIWLKTTVGVGCSIGGGQGNNKVHLKGGFSPVFLLLNPEFDHFTELTENFRNFNFEMQLGAGIDIGRVFIDLEFHQTLIRKINTSSIVENTLVIGLGCKM